MTQSKYRVLPSGITRVTYKGISWEMRSEIDAAFICNAVNNFDSLLEALQKVVNDNLFNPEFVGMDSCQKLIEKITLSITTKTN